MLSKECCENCKFVARTTPLMCANMNSEKICELVKAEDKCDKYERSRK